MSKLWICLQFDTFTSFQTFRMKRKKKKPAVLSQILQPVLFLLTNPQLPWFSLSYMT